FTSVLFHVSLTFFPGRARLYARSKIIPCKGGKGCITAKILCQKFGARDFGKRKHLRRKPQVLLDLFQLGRDTVDVGAFRGVAAALETLEILRGVGDVAELDGIGGDAVGLFEQVSQAFAGG
ncbi:MAG: hypothetical protein IKD37_09575, partial [Clostridia bacterium]|nr:hypothetical protein [Clostridia bacterium]